MSTAAAHHCWGQQGMALAEGTPTGNFNLYKDCYMSWNVSVVCTGRNASIFASEELNKYGGGSPTTDAIDKLFEAFAGQFPDRKLLLESSGHIDVSHGQFTVSARIIYNDGDASK